MTTLLNPRSLPLAGTPYIDEARQKTSIKLIIVRMLFSCNEVSRERNPHRADLHCATTLNISIYDELNTHGKRQIRRRKTPPPGGMPAAADTFFSRDNAKTLTQPSA
jgi:hypothetical protein